jgi:hypothetical protein
LFYLLRGNGGTTGFSRRGFVCTPATLPSTPYPITTTSLKLATSGCIATFIVGEWMRISCV